MCAGYLKKLWTDPGEILWGDWVCDTDVLFRSWLRSGSGSDDQNFLSDYSPLRDRTKNDTQHDISESCGRIWMTLGGQVRCVIRTN